MNLNNFSWRLRTIDAQVTSHVGWQKNLTSIARLCGKHKSRLWSPLILDRLCEETIRRYVYWTLVTFDLVKMNIFTLILSQEYS